MADQLSCVMIKYNWLVFSIVGNVQARNPMIIIPMAKDIWIIKQWQNASKIWLLLFSH